MVERRATTRFLAAADAHATTLMNPIAATTAFALARGVGVDEITAATGLALAELLDPEARLPEESLHQLWRLLAAAAPNTSIALEMAAAAPLSIFGAVAQGAQCARDLRGALELFVRYRSILSTRAEISLVERDDEAALILRHPLDATDGGHAAELGLAMSARFAREVLRLDAMLLRVEFIHAPFGPVAAYRAFFAAPVMFSRPGNGLYFRAADLGVPFPQHDPIRLRVIQSQLDLVSEGLRGGAGGERAELTRIRAAIAENAAAGEYGAGPLARRLGVGLRTLQRQAIELGTSVRELLEAAREVHARELLAEDRHGLDEIAERLGYSTESAFRRAFRRWTGTSPGRARRRGSGG